jgi:hypothetical protein
MILSSKTKIQRTKYPHQRVRVLTREIPFLLFKKRGLNYRRRLLLGLPKIRQYDKKHLNYSFLSIIGSILFFFAVRCFGGIKYFCFLLLWLNYFFGFGRVGIYGLWFQIF